MAKKTAKRSAPERVAFQTRLRKETHEKLAQAAKEGGISMNLLVEGILGACAGRLVSGRPRKVRLGEQYVVTTEESPGCFYFGHKGKRFVRYPASQDEFDAWCQHDRHVPELAEYEVGTSDDAQHGRVEPGELWFVLDHSSSPIRYGNE